MSQKNEKIQRVVTFLNRSEVDFLDKLGKDALFSSGSKVSRAKLIAWLIDILKGLNINGENIRSENDLQERILEGLNRYFREGSVPPPATADKNGKVPGGNFSARRSDTKLTMKGGA